MKYAKTRRFRTKRARKSGGMMRRMMNTFRRSRRSRNRRNVAVLPMIPEEEEGLVVVSSRGSQTRRPHRRRGAIHPLSTTSPEEMHRSYINPSYASRDMQRMAQVMLERIDVVKNRRYGSHGEPAVRNA